MDLLEEFRTRGSQDLVRPALRISQVVGVAEQVLPCQDLGAEAPVVDQDPLLKFLKEAALQVVAVVLHGNQGGSDGHRNPSNFRSAGPAP